MADALSLFPTDERPDTLSLFDAGPRHRTTAPEPERLSPCPACAGSRDEPHPTGLCGRCRSNGHKPQQLEVGNG